MQSSFSFKLKCNLLSPSNYHLSHFLLQTIVEGFTTQVVTLWCFNTVGRKILTLGEGFTTQVVTLWCFNTVGRKILTVGEGFTTQVVTPLC